MPTKLCAHVISNSNDAQRLCFGAVSPIIKLMDDYKQAASLNAISPKTRPLRIGRVYEPGFIDPNALYQSTDPIHYAQVYFDKFLVEKVRGWPDVDAWEGPNEPHPDNLDAMRWYAKFEAERTRILAIGYNRKSVVGNFSMGTPDLPPTDRLAYWRAFDSALRAANTYSGILGVHEYSGLNFAKWDSWLFFRYRWAREYCVQAGLGGLKFAVTECGADNAPDGGSDWHTLFGSDPKRYLNEMLIHYDTGLRQDPYMLGATIFTFGNGWGTHNVEGSGLTDLIIQYSQGLDQQVPPISVPYTHQVIAGKLNVRAFPWTGSITPPIVRQLNFHDGINVHCPCGDWVCINSNGNEWVSAKYIKEV